MDLSFIHLFNSKQPFMIFQYIITLFLQKTTLLSIKTTTIFCSAQIRRSFSLGHFLVQARISQDLFFFQLCTYHFLLYFLLYIDLEENPTHFQLGCFFQLAKSSHKQNRFGEGQMEAQGTLVVWTHWMVRLGSAEVSTILRSSKYFICVEFLSHNIIRLQVVKIGILFMLSFQDD